MEMGSDMADVQAFTITQFTKRHNVGRDKVYSEIKAGRLHSYILGSRRLISRRAADEWQTMVEMETAPVGAPLAIKRPHKARELN
jgi:excisionase family DNA binding protein